MFLHGRFCQFSRKTYKLWVLIRSPSLRSQNKNLKLIFEPRSSGFPTRSDTNRTVQPQKVARGLKFRIYI